jgi:outer membrane protein W
MKKAMFVLALLFFCFVGLANAQEKGKFRVGLDLGYTVPSAGGGGILYYLEPKYNIQENMNIGLRIGGATMARDVVYIQSTDDATGKLSANGIIALTYDYYFKKPGSNFAPFVGAGLGWARFGSFEVDTTIDPDDYGTLSTNSAIAPMIRAGFEARKFRLGLDYNFIPKSDLVNLQGDVIGTSANSYLGIAIGFYVGGGKWRN